MREREGGGSRDRKGRGSTPGSGLDSAGAGAGASRADRPRPPLTRERVLDAALAVVDAQGLEALTMRRLGAELGVEAMSVYHHVPGKPALLDGLVERFLTELRPPPVEIAWDQRLRSLAHALRAVTLAHPHVFPLVATRPLRGEAAIALVEATLDALRDAGLGAEETVSAFWALVAYLTGALLAEIATAIGLSDEPSTGLAPGVVRGLDRARFPRVHELAAAMAQSSFEQEYERGLELVLDAVRRRLGGGRLDRQDRAHGRRLCLTRLPIRGCSGRSQLL